MNEYREWFLKNWGTKGLIQPSRAGKIIGVRGARVTQIWKERKYPMFTPPGEKKPLIAWNEVIAYIQEKENKK